MALGTFLCSTALPSISCRIPTQEIVRGSTQQKKAKLSVSLSLSENSELIAWLHRVARAIISFLQQKWRFHLRFHDSSKQTKTRSSEYETALERSGSLIGDKARSAFAAPRSSLLTLLTVFGWLVICRYLPFLKVWCICAAFLAPPPPPDTETAMESTDCLTWAPLPRAFQSSPVPRNVF